MASMYILKVITTSNFKFLAPTISYKGQFQQVFGLGTSFESFCTEVKFRLCSNKDGHQHLPDGSSIIIEISSVFLEIITYEQTNTQNLFLYNICIELQILKNMNS